MKRNIFTGILSLLLCVLSTSAWAESISIADVRGRSAAEAEMVVSAALDDDVTAVEIKMQVPAGTSYVDGSASIADGRTNGHSISVGVKDGQLRVYIYTLAGKALLGTDGELCRLKVRLGSGTGVFTSVPVASVVTTGMEKRNVACGTLSVETVSPRIMVETTRLDFGRVLVGTEAARGIRLTNTGNDVLHITGVDCPGTDLTLQGEGDIEVCPGESCEVYVTLAPKSPGMIATKMTLVSDAANVCPNIEVSAEAYEGNEINYIAEFDEETWEYVLSMNLNNQTEVAAIETVLMMSFDLEYIEGSAQLTDRAADHILHVSKDSKWAVRIMLYSLTSSSFKGNDGAVLTMRFRSTNASMTQHDFRWDGGATVIGTRTGSNVNSQQGWQSTVCPESPHVDWYCQSPAATCVSGEPAIVNIGVVNYEGNLIVKEVRINHPDFECIESLPLSVPYPGKSLRVAYRGTAPGKHIAVATVITNRGPQTINLELNLQEACVRIEDQYQDQTGSVYLMNLVLSNSTDITAVQMDIQLPTWYSIVLDEANITYSDRVKDHSHVLSRVGDNLYRLIIYSMSNKPIAGNSGTIVTIPVRKDDGSSMAGQTIYVSNVVMSDARGGKQSQPDIMHTTPRLANLTSFVNGGEGGTIEYLPSGPVMVNSTVTFKAIANDGWSFERWWVDGVEYTDPVINIQVEDWTTVVAYFVKNECTLPGDANGDGKVDVKDAVLINNYYMGKEGVTIDEAAADANGDGVVNVKDAVWVVNTFLGSAE